MAITGEIDLTEGLDFYRHKKLPSIKKGIPWIRERGNILSVKSEANEDTIISTWTYHYNSGDGTNVVSVDVSDLYPSGFITSSTTTSSISTTYRISNSSFQINYINDDNIITNTYNWYGTCSDSSSRYISSKCEISSEKPFKLWSHKKKEVYKKPFCRCISCNSIILGSNNICSKCNEINKSNLSYDWKAPLKYHYDNIDEDFGIIPWDNYNNNNESLKRLYTRAINRSRENNKCRSIPWLSKLSSRIYGYYIDELRNGESGEEAKKLSSYLTNMNWIGVSEHGDRPRYTNWVDRNSDNIDTDRANRILNEISRNLDQDELNSIITDTFLAV